MHLSKDSRFLSSCSFFSTENDSLEGGSQSNVYAFPFIVMNAIKITEKDMTKNLFVFRNLYTVECFIEFLYTIMVFDKGSIEIHVFLSDLKTVQIENKINRRTVIKYKKAFKPSI